jgi:hypothetical protein
VGDRERASDATMRGRCCGGAHTRILNDACVRELRSKREDAWEQARLIEKAVGRAEWSEACEAAHGICGSRRRERSNVRVRVAWAKVQARGNSVFGCATRARVGIGDTTGDRGRPRGATCAGSKRSQGTAMYARCERGQPAQIAAGRCERPSQGRGPARYDQPGARSYRPDSLDSAYVEV